MEEDEMECFWIACCIGVIGLDWLDVFVVGGKLEDFKSFCIWCGYFDKCGGCFVWCVCSVGIGKC